MTIVSTTIRVSLDQRERLRTLAERRRASMADTLDAALEALRREDFYRHMARAEAELKGDSDRWAAYVAERDVWLDAAIVE